MPKVKLTTKLEDFEELYRVLDGTRANTKFISVPRHLLSTLLMDHSTMISALKDQVVEPPSIYDKKEVKNDDIETEA